LQAYPCGDENPNENGLKNLMENNEKRTLGMAGEDELKPLLSCELAKVREVWGG
jgi:hypothetical protein